MLAWYQQSSVLPCNQLHDQSPMLSIPAGTHKGPDGVRLATRSMLLLAAYCQETGAHAEANYALMRAHFQVNFCGFKVLLISGNDVTQKCSCCV
jgi:hypothetical protein